jgi:phosphohistidine swiveling domain-containing protein
LPPRDDIGGRARVTLDEIAGLLGVARSALSERGVPSGTWSALWSLAVRELQTVGARRPLADRDLAARAAQGFEAIGGLEGIRSMVTEAVGGPVPRPAPTIKAHQPAGRLQGSPLAAGRVSGPCRLASSDPAERWSGDDVLVCRRLEAVTERAAAIVVESGTPASNPIRAARERGIPVVRLPGATSRLPEGATAIVDGNLGQVVLRPADLRTARGGAEPS